MTSSDALICELLETPDLAGRAFSEEEQRIADSISSSKRKDQFLLGRAAAHFALKTLLKKAGETFSIPRGKNGEPLWPEGVVGSISHTDGAGVAVVGPATEFEGLGIDIERTTRVISEGALKKIALPAERVWITEDPKLQKLRSLQVFCAKESIYKAYFPLTRKEMTFKDAFVRWEEEHQAFVGTLLSDLNEVHQAGDLLVVHCTVNAPYLMCCAIIPRIADD